MAQAFLTDVETAAKAQVQLYEIMGANAQRFDLHAWPLFNVILHSPKLTLTALLVYLSDLTFFSLLCHDACRDRFHLRFGMTF